MSTGSQETQSDTACPAEPPVYFSNPLMSDVESDWSPIHDAAFNGRVLSLQRLISQGICVNLSTLDRVSPLHGACLQGNTNCAKILVENGANVNSTTVDGHTALADACAGGHVTCASLLLLHGATPLGTSPSSSPIHLAAAKGHPECIEMLAQHSADVDQHIHTLGSPLHAACSNQQLGSVKKLLQLGADVNRSLAGDSPLHIAARLSSPELVSALLDHGADHLLVNSEGKRPLDLTPPDSLVGRLLREAGGIPSLKQLCRLHIRKTVGKRRLGGIPDLHLPKKLLQYLLYQSEQSTQITSSKQPHTLSFEHSGQQGENLDNLAGQCPSETDYKESLEISES